MNASIETIENPDPPLADDAHYDAHLHEASDFNQDDEFLYQRSLSTSAIVSFCFALASILTFLDTFYLFLPIIAVLVAIASASRIRKYQDELYGRGLTVAAIAIAVVMFASSLGWHSYVYATEVPEGYTRLDFLDLQPDSRHPDALAKRIEKLQGKKVFIKGFMYPGNQKDEITNFILCRDQGDCCFGGDPKITERMSVKLDDSIGISLSKSMQKLTGEFRFEPTSAANDIGKGQILFHLDHGAKR